LKELNKVFKFEDMETMTLENLLEKRSWRLHTMIFLFSLLVVVFFSVFTSEYFTAEDQISLFILLVIQLELFITLAVKFFRDVKPGLERKELTRILLSRFALFMIICFAIALAIVIAFIIVRSLIHNIDAMNEIRGFFYSKFEGWLKGTIGGLLFGAAIFIFVQWQDALKREQKLREENLIFQNETLKTQINPHFLFNNLNTISSLIASRPEDAEKFVSRLSSIYRYIIENSIKDRVTLSEELSFISDYFFLYRIRDEEKIKLEVTIENAAFYFVLPVSLQVLVGNAIKHNKATREEPLTISVFLEGENVVVRNNLQRMASQIRSTGIGLKNLAERVRLISGKALIVEDSEDYFTVKIPLLK
jgi:sensor histidine kinase YesM